jgi:chromatin remodeling complex protein RSC6
MSKNKGLDNLKEDLGVLNNDFKCILNNLSTLKNDIKLLTITIKNLEKKVNKKIKVLEKQCLKNKNKGNRKPTGFASLGPVSKELCNFMKVEIGSEFARTEVTKYIINYIKEKDLQDKHNKKVIKLDNALKTLLNPKKDHEITYFNLQSHMNKHFVKKQDQ